METKIPKFPRACLGCSCVPNTHIICDAQVNDPVLADVVEQVTAENWKEETKCYWMLPHFQNFIFQKPLQPVGPLGAGKRKSQLFYGAGTDKPVPGHVQGSEAGGTSPWPEALFP